jgi:hypothetical protein
MNKNHFKFFCTAANGFIEQYKYNGYVEELFDDPLLIPCQFTGFQDIKGNDLYEGDVVKFHKDKVGYIDFEFGSFLLRIKNPSTTMGFIFLHAVGSLEIIGNKFENPELI